MIPAALLYLGQMQLALLLLLGVYYLALRRLTFHGLNRLYLLGSVALAALYPLLDLSSLSLRSAPPAAAAPLRVVPAAWLSESGPTTAAPAWWMQPAAWIWLVYGLGVAVLLLRLGLQAGALWRLHRRSQPAKAAGVGFRALAEPASPFSFGRHIYLNPATVPAEELPTVLLHEQVHVRQGHSLDVLLGQLHGVLVWWSPAAWLWLLAAQENLEFLVDATVLRESAVARRTYQYSLLRQSTRGAVSAFATSFAFITLTTRIRMMNSPQSSLRQLARYVAGLSLLAGLAAACATPKAAETPQPSAADGRRSLDKLTYLVDGQPTSKSMADALEGDNILTMHIFKGNKVAPGVNLEALRQDFGSKLDDGLAFIYTKANAGSAAVQAFNAKYGIKLGDPAALEASTNATKVLYQQLLDGKGLTDEQIAGRLILIDNMPATPAQLRALPPSVIIGFSTTEGANDRAVARYGEVARKGLLIVMTKSADMIKMKPQPAAPGN